MRCSAARPKGSTKRSRSRFDQRRQKRLPTPFREDMEADAHFGASVFWVRRSGALGGEQAMVEYWQVRRDGGRRGIVEIVPEVT